MTAFPLSTARLGHGASGVRLSRLSVSHADALRAAADVASIWTWFPRRGDGAHFDAMWTYLRAEQRAKRWVPYAVSVGEQVVGMTCFLNIVAEASRVEIGGTWFNPSAQGGLANPASKLLMIERAFGWGAERVEFKTDARNGQSRAALKKLGATEEGVLRRHQRRPDGSLRDTVYFSILREEWGWVREGLDARLGKHP